MAKATPPAKRARIVDDYIKDELKLSVEYDISVPCSSSVDIRDEAKSWLAFLRDNFSMSRLAVWNDVVPAHVKSYILSMGFGGGGDKTPMCVIEEVSDEESIRYSETVEWKNGWLSLLVFFQAVGYHFHRLGMQTLLKLMHATIIRYLLTLHEIDAGTLEYCKDTERHHGQEYT